MKVLKYLAVPAMALAMLASCSKKDEPKQDGPKDLVVSLSLGGGTRAAISAAADKIANNAAASVQAVDIYLVDAANKVVTAKRFKDAELTQLMKGSQLGKADDNGWKFNDVNASVSKVITVVNPQADPSAEGAALSIADLTLMVNANQAVYYNVSSLATATEVENYGHDPNNPGRKVIAMNIKAAGLMNRFQVEDVDFVAIKFKDDAAKAEYLAAANAFVAAKVAGGMTKEAALDAWKTDATGMNRSSYTNPTATVGFGGGTKTWNDYFVVKNVSADNTGLFMNRFNNQYTLGFNADKLGTMKTPLHIAKYADGYTNTNGTLSFAGTDRSDVASYYVAGGLKSVLTVDDADPAKNKVAAFNFFANDDNTTKLVYAKTAGTAPTLHFYIGGTTVSDAARYVNILGYTGEASFTDANMAKGAQLLTINIRKAGDIDGNDATPNPDGDGDGKPDGPVVDSDDPTVPGIGGSDITDDGKKNLAVHVTVTPWTNNNVKPQF